VKIEAVKDHGRIVNRTGENLVVVDLLPPSELCVVLVKDAITAEERDVLTGPIEHVKEFLQRGELNNELDPLLGGTRTWKVSHWRFIKRDEKERKERLYMYILSIL
jgi:hypothetical protein